MDGPRVNFDRPSRSGVGVFSASLGMRRRQFGANWMRDGDLSSRLYGFESRASAQVRQGCDMRKSKTTPSLARSPAGPFQPRAADRRKRSDNMGTMSDKNDDEENKRGLARNDHPETSHDAADEIESVSGRQRRIVYLAIAQAENGMTDEEIQRATGLNPSSERPRRVELCDAGKVVDSGTTRPTSAKRKAIVWKVA